MLGKLKPGAKVGFEIKNENDVYEIGDIIVFNQDDVNIIHEVISYSTDSNGEITYRTKGVNNEYIDSRPVPGDKVIGKVVDLTRSELSGLMDLVKLGRIPYITAMAMPKQTETIKSDRQLILEQLIKNGISKDELIKEIGSETILISDFEQFYDVKTFEEAQAYVMGEFLISLQEKFVLADQALTELWENGYKIIDPNNNDALNNLDEFCHLLWGKDYNDKLIERAGIESYFNKVYRTNDIIKTKYKEFLHERIIKQGTEKLDLWFKLGYHNYLNPDHGDGLEHAFQHHEEDFLKWGFETYKERLDFVKDIISNNIGIRAGHNTILYKIVDGYGRDDYMFVAYDVNDGHIRNVYGIDKRGYEGYPHLLPKFNFLLNYYYI